MVEIVVLRNMVYYSQPTPAAGKGGHDNPLSDSWPVIRIRSPFQQSGT
jgi:hypothetical protein